MHRVLLERCFGSRNISRFYELSISRCVVGGFVFERRWGRIGTQGTLKRVSYPTEQSAMKELVSFRRKKIKRGYFVKEASPGIAPEDVQTPADPNVKTVLAACQLEATVLQLPFVEETRFGLTARELGSACRHRRLQRPRGSDPRQHTLGFPIDALDHRVRSRIFVLVDELISAQFTDLDLAAFRSPVRDASNAVASGRVIRAIPRTRSTYMNLDVVESLAGDRALTGVAFDLYRAGKMRLGDVAMLSFEELLQFANGNAELIRRIEQKMAEFGLRIDSRAPWWQRGSCSYQEIMA